MTDNYVLHSDHLAHRQSGQNCVIAKDDIGKPRPHCNGIDVRANGRPCGQSTEWDAVGAGEMIWKWKNHTPSPDLRHSHAPKSSGSRASSMKQSDKASLSSAGKENRPRGPQSSLSACVRNDVGNDMEERLVDNYRYYAVEKNRKEQPLRIKMTNHTRTKILRTRNPEQAPQLKDRWLMSRFKNVPSHFEQDRALAKSSSTPDLKPQEQTPAVLNWPPQLEIISKSDVAGSRISATPSNIRLSSDICSHVSGEVHQQSQVSASVPASQLLVRQSAALSNVSLNPPASQLSLVEPGTTCLSASTPAPVGASSTSGVSGRPPLCLQRPASAGANFCSASSRLSASLQRGDQASLAGTTSAPAIPLAPAVRKPRPSSSRPSALRPIPEEANSSGLRAADATRLTRYSHSGSLALTVPPRTRPSSAEPSSVAASQLPSALAEVRHKAHWDMGSPIETPGQARSMKGDMAEGRPGHQHRDRDAEALSDDCHADTRSKLHLPRSRSLGPKPCRSCLCW